MLRENGTGKQETIGLFDNGMKPVREGFLGLGLDALKRCAASPWVSIDEIGFLETGCPEYLEELERLLDTGRVIAVIRKQELPFLTGLLAREDAFVIDLDAPFGNLGCVIMASGLGKRFGGNKLMADFGGEPMLARVLETTDFLPHRVVVTRHRDAAQYCESRGISAVLHSLPFRSDTVRLGLEALPEAEGCFFCPGDQPLLRRETVMSLALLGLAMPDKILRPAAQGQPGAPILFPRQFFPELLTLPEGKGGGFVAKKYPEKVYFLPVHDAKELMDVDTPEDLAALLEK